MSISVQLLPPAVRAAPGAQRDTARARAIHAPAVGARHGELVSAARALTTRHARASKKSAHTRPGWCRADAEEMLPPFLKYAKGSAASQKRSDIKSIMILGAGPIVIGQACEFDYSGTQACKALKEEGYRVILINSNPATIMTDPETADATYVTPMTPELVEQILEKEKPDAILPTMGGQTALNLAKALAENGALERHGVELIGAKLDAINKAEDRDLFKKAMQKINLSTPKSGTATTMEDAWAIAKDIGRYPLIIRPAFTLGGTGGGIAYNPEEFEQIVKAGIFASATNQVLVEQSLLGWKEYELEVMRDLNDNCMIVCSIENIDPMGVHTGDSITVAPAQTLTDKEYQRLRDASLAIMREIGVECGGSNCQFAINPEDGELMVIEMNPRVSRSSALASKATGYPIAKMAAKLAIGYTLEIIPNDITRKTPASFEPSIDYVVTKIPRFAFEKFPGASNNLTTQMKSVGEAMAFGRTFQESFQKAWRSLETGLDGWAGCDRNRSFSSIDKQKLTNQLRVPNPDRMADIYTAFKIGMTQKEIQDITWMDPWFLSQMKQLVEAEEFVIATPLAELTAADFQALKQRGFSDSQLGKATGHPEMKIRETRKALGVRPAFKRVDTCAAEFDASTPYMYSSYDGHDEAEAENKKKVLILGGGPNRIGQGIEFDYCCCHASFSLRAAGYDTIMMNSNPETVSTDYDTSSRLYFEPLTVEDVLNVVESERPDGIVVQFGGQTPLKLATALDKALKEMQLPTSSGEGIVKIWGTSPDAIDEAEDRERFEKLLKKLDIAQPPGYAARSEKEALDAAGKIGYPVMVRPSYVLGGRAMEIVYDDDALKYYIKTAVQLDTNQPVLVDKYLSDATEIDCDALCDKDGEVTIAGIMEHIEQAGVHSGDSACSLPTQTIPAAALAEIRASTAAIARELNVVGLINIQWAVSREGKVYIIEANPRASRTVPFVAKAIGHPVAKYASLLMSGKTLKELNFTEEVVPSHVAVKEAVLPFDKFPGADALLGPEMRSTGEVMGIDASFEMAYAKAQIAAGQRLPQEGNVFISMNELNKPGAVPVAQKFEAMGFGILATGGTATVLQEAGVKVTKVLKLHEGRPHIGDLLRSGEVQLMFVTAGDDESERVDGRDLRRLALAQKVPLVTTVAGGRANASAIEGMKAAPISMDALQGFLP